MIESIIGVIISAFEKHGIAVAFLIVMIILYITLLFYFKIAIDRFLSSVNDFRVESSKQREDCAKDKAIMRELHIAEKQSIIHLHLDERRYLQEERKEQKEDFLNALRDITRDKNQT